MPGERPSHIPPENPFGSSEGKHPPEPTEKFVERYLGKRRGAATSAGEPAAAEPADLATPEERAAREEAVRAELGPLHELVTAEATRLGEFFGDEVEVPPPPPEITPERIQEWKELGFALHYLPHAKIIGDEPGLKVPLNLNNISKEKIEVYENPSGPYMLNHNELPGSWILIDTRPKPQYTDGTQRYDNDTEIEAALGGSRFSKSWNQLHEPATLAKLARILNVEPSQVRLPRMIEFNVLGNLHHPEWGQTNTYEWFEDSYNRGQGRLHGGSSDLGGLASVYPDSPGFASGGVGFRPLVSFPSS